MRQHGRRFRRLEARIRRRSEGQRDQRLDRFGFDGDELRECDDRRRSRPAKFGLSLDQFLAKWGASTIVARGRALKQSQGALFASIQQRYGVPPGPLIAIWGMETGFGSQRGNQNMLSSIATLAYDCRRSQYFTEQLYAALQLIDRGALSAGTRGSMHGEVGQTQFLPKNILAYGTGNLDNAANALNSTANFQRAHGWRAGAGYQAGERDFAAIQAGNAAQVYQRAIALMGRQIEGGE
jgi:membrane-bound lytic murein transglycosylase B